MCRKTVKAKKMKSYRIVKAVLRRCRYSELKSVNCLRRCDGAASVAGKKRLRLFYI